MKVNNINYVDVKKHLTSSYPNDDGGNPRFLFRGQNKDYGRVNTSIQHLCGFQGSQDEWKLIQRQACSLFRYAKEAVNGLSGTLGMKKEDGIALLQHYGWLTPFLDLTGKVDVALFFASLDSLPLDESTIYVIDLNLLPNYPDLVLHNHDFLVRDIPNGAFEHRWLKQDGYALALERWEYTLDVSFDLLNYPLLIAEQLIFSVPENNITSSWHPYLDISNDTIPQQLQNIIKILFEQPLNGHLPLHPYLEQRLNNMYP